MIIASPFFRRPYSFSVNINYNYFMALYTYLCLVPTIDNFFN